MKVDCIVDGRTLSLSLNSNKPLSLILQENLESNTANAHCRGKMCGLCAVMIDGKAVLSCMVPAFEIRGKEITTFDSFKKTKEMKDIEKAFDIIGAEPCPECYSSRVIIMESLISRNETRPEEIIKELGIIKCSCLDAESEVKIVQKAIEFRRKRRVRRA